MTTSGDDFPATKSIDGDSKNLGVLLPESSNSLSSIGVGVELSSPRKQSGGATTTVSDSSPDDASSKEVMLLAAGRASSSKSLSFGSTEICSLVEIYRITLKG